MSVYFPGRGKTIDEKKQFIRNCWLAGVPLTEVKENSLVYGDKALFRDVAFVLDREMRRRNKMFGIEEIKDNH